MPGKGYAGPMAPWPGLAAYGRLVTLAGGQRLFVFEAGAAGAPALLLIHGLGDEADTWRHVFEPLAAHYHVVAADLPGFGRSDPLRRYSLPALRDALLALLDALRLPSAILAGSSMGAMLAQMMAAQAPRRAAELVLVDGTVITGGAPLSWPMLAMALPLVGERLYTGYRRDPRAAYESLRRYYADLDALPPADRSFLFQRVNERVWSDTQRQAYLATYRAAAWSAGGQGRTLAAALARSGIPTRIIWGERDIIMPVRVAQALRELQPAARLTLIPGAGHLPHQEQPAAFLQAVLAAAETQPA
jgi:pimeloyl-ACP methyl ester carboxylesterase